MQVCPLSMTVSILEYIWPFNYLMAFTAPFVAMLAKSTLTLKDSRLSQFDLYSPISQNTNFPQGALQSVQ